MENGGNQSGGDPQPTKKKIAISLKLKSNRIPVGTASSRLAEKAKQSVVLPSASENGEEEEEGEMAVRYTDILVKDLARSIAPSGSQIQNVWEMKHDAEDAPMNDSLDQYMDEIQATTVSVTARQEAKSESEPECLDSDSDHEVYQAKGTRYDETVSGSESDNSNPGYLSKKQQEKENLKLPVTEHDKSEYTPFIRMLLRDRIDDTDASSLRKQFRISVQHIDPQVSLKRRSSTLPICPPIKDFRQLQDSLGRDFIHHMQDKCRIQDPTAIQMQTIPLLLLGNDLIGIAPTSNGKTFAFLIPLIIHVKSQSRIITSGSGPMALILAPSRELAAQIRDDFCKICFDDSIKLLLVTGGMPKFEQFKQIRDGGNHIIVATPGRLIDMIKMKACRSLFETSFLVIDEADKLLDSGFEDQVKSIINQTRRDRQLACFSATYRPNLLSLFGSAKDHRLDMTCDLYKVEIARGEKHGQIDQEFLAFDSETRKYEWLYSHLRQLFADEAQDISGAEAGGSTAKDLVLIFTSTRAACADLTNRLRRDKIPTLALHGEIGDSDRVETIEIFKQAQARILVATDLAARGLHVQNIFEVINYEVATSYDTHVHRVGRTGRAGSHGTAYTCLLHNDSKDIKFVQALQSHWSSIDDGRFPWHLENMIRSPRNRDHQTNQERQRGHARKRVKF